MFKQKATRWLAPIAVLEARGMRKHRRKEAGHITTEAYW